MELTKKQLEEMMLSDKELSALLKEERRRIETVGIGRDEHEKPAWEDLYAELFRKLSKEDRGTLKRLWLETYYEGFAVGVCRVIRVERERLADLLRWAKRQEK